MANNVWRHSSFTEVKQVKTFTITAAGAASDVWTLTLTDDDGKIYTAIYTNDSTPTIAEAVTGLKNSWNNSTKPPLTRITATEASGTDVILTADTAGRPFSVALTNSGTGTSSAADTTANQGISDYGSKENWELDAVPVASNDVIFPAGSVAAKYSLNQSSVAIGDFLVESGYSGEIGRIEDGLGHYLRIDPDKFEYRGKGALGMFDVGAAAIALYVESHGSPGVSGRHTLYLKGSAISTLEVVKGNVGVAALDGDTATITTILCGFLQSLQGDVDLTIGSGVTLTTLTQYGGFCKLKAAATTVSNGKNASLTTEGTGAITTLHAFGTCYPNSTGAITTLNCWGTVDFSRDRSARTISTLNAKPGGKVILHSGITVTTFALPANGGSFTIEYLD